MSSAVRVALWGVPRSYSSLFERSILQIENSHAFHEPYFPAYYHGPERQSKLFNSPKNNDASYDKITHKLKDTMNDIEKSEKASLFFIKDMAKHISNRFDSVVPSLHNFQHSFLIHHPKEAIRTLYRDLTNGIKLAGDEFDISECVESYKQIHELYEYLKQRGSQKVIPLIDSDDLINHPSHVMYNYCTVFGLPYDASMLTWDNSIEMHGWQIWNGMIDVELKSGGLDKIPQSSADIKDKIKYPHEVEEAINESLPYYEKMIKKKTYWSK